MVGIIAGILDLVPMIIQKLTWDANISAFSMWVVIGILIAVSDIKIKGVFKGIIISLLVLLSPAVLIAWKQPVAMIPILIMTIILGGASGFAISKINKE